ncbi:MAG: glycosyl hydrolase family 28 protein [Opitutaceae bacterium]|nr:glycosyl hydrolase family 28 protein [Opitutaceae bacterium]
MRTPNVLALILFWCVALATLNAAAPAYRYSSGVPRSEQFQVEVDGAKHEVICSTAGDFVRFESSNASSLVITCQGKPTAATVRPMRLGTTAILDGHQARIELPAGAAAMVEFEGIPPLFVFSDLPEKSAPKPGDPGVVFFEAGKLYDAGEIRLEKGQHAYLQAGAVVRGYIRATHADGVTVSGRGILDGTLSKLAGEKRRMILIEDSSNVTLRDICLTETTSWMTVLAACRDSRISGLRELGEPLASDGIDLVGCQRIVVEDCFLRNGDDCIAIKSFDLSAHDKTMRINPTRDVEDIEIRRCTVIAFRGGCGFEIGHELRTTSVRNIRYIDCDVLGVHGFGAPLAMRVGDRATVSGILYENIRIEHYYDKLLDFRVMRSRYSADEQRGHIKDVTLRNVQVTVNPYNPGYSPAIIGGWDEEHAVRGVRFENMTLNGVPVTIPREIDLYSRFAYDVTFVVADKLQK